MVKTMQETASHVPGFSVYWILLAVFPVSESFDVVCIVRKMSSLLLNLFAANELRHAGREIPIK